MEGSPTQFAGEFQGLIIILFVIQIGFLLFLRNTLIKKREKSFLIVQSGITAFLLGLSFIVFGYGKDYAVVFEAGIDTGILSQLGTLSFPYVTIGLACVIFCLNLSLFIKQLRGGKEES